MYRAKVETEELMKKHFLSAFVVAALLTGCTAPSAETEETTQTSTENFQWKTDQFADLKIVRYQVPGWEKLTLEQKKYAYYLVQAGLAGRDMIYDQNYRHNLKIRKALEHIIANYSGDRKSENWTKFETYAKRVWFSNGIHHHYSGNKIEPGITEAYFRELLSTTNHKLADEAITAIFDPVVDNKKVNLDPSKDLVLASAVNFYEPTITQKEVEKYYKSIIDPSNKKPVEYGLNTKLVRNEEGKVVGEPYKVGGLYGAALEKVVYWLDKAAGVAENQEQADALRILIEYYQTGDLEKWSAYNIAWSQATKGDIDYIQGFVEVYNDPMGYKGSYEGIVQIKDFDASERMAVLQDNAQWFEDQSTILPEHKKENVVGVTYKVVNVAGEAGDASPSTPIGVNLPNSRWIRAEHGSKSVSLGNIIAAYENAGGGGLLEEFCYTQEEVDRAKKHSTLAGKMHTAMHEVIGHASGKLEEGVGTPKETLKNYSSALEEGRADLVGLYYIMDPKLVELGLVESLEVGKCEYDSYIRNGLMLQLRRLKEGEDIEEAHMRNRQMIAAWAYEKGQEENIIERKEKDGKTYFVVNDYEKLRGLFGELLKEVQRIISKGDYAAGKNMIETYAVKVDTELHKEVLNRSEKLNIAPYGGFINPTYQVVEDENGNITDIKIQYPDNFVDQMLDYGKQYSFLQ